MAGGGDRQMLGPERYTGTILDWKGKYGWIAPNSPIEHPAAMKRGGKVFLSIADVEEELEGVGATVSFVAYADQNGLGAMSVKAASGGQAAGGCGGGGGGGGGWAAGGGGGGWGGKGGGGKGGKGGGGGGGGDAMGAMMAAMAKGMGMKGGFGGFGFGGAEAMQSWAPGAGSWGGGGGGGGGWADPKKVPNRLHKVVNDGVWKAVQGVTNADAEWTPEEMCKRIVKYLYKAGSSPELLAMPWPDAAQQYVENAMHGYSAACGDRPWFFELDLSKVLCAGCWEIVRASSCPPRANWPEMEQVATAKYEEVMDGILTEKAMWDAVEEVFGEESFSNKIYKTLKATHEASYTEACNQWGLADQQRVEMFMGCWMENSIGRAWQALDNSELQLNPDVLTRLFTKLLIPFGEEHPFSCVPAALTQSCGRPPSSWPFIRATAEALYQSWLDPSSAQPSKKRKTGSKSGGGAAWGGGGGWKAAEQGETDVVGAMLQAEAAAALV